MISGIPATGKSTLAIKLAGILDFKVCLGVDEIKEIVKYYDNDPFIKCSSHDAWKLLGDRAPKNIIHGFKRYCAGLKPGVESVINRSCRTGENIIIEGVQLLPYLYSRIDSFEKLHIILESDLQNGHTQNIEYKVRERHSMQPDVWSNKLPEFRLIQQLLMQQAKNSDDCFVLPFQDMEQNLKEIIRLIGKHEISRP